MAAAGVPTARAAVVSRRRRRAMAAVARARACPVAIKADGLAAGKGVMVVATEAEARAALEACLVARRFGEAGRVVVVEEGMTGPEVSLLAVTRRPRGGAASRPPATTSRIGEGNTGPEHRAAWGRSPRSPTSRTRWPTSSSTAVHRPVIAAMERRGTPFTGVLYAGLMMTPDGPRVLEFNARFGDPETQALLPRLDEDALAPADRGGRRRPARTGRCGVNDGAAVAVVLAAARLPGRARAGRRHHGLDEAARDRRRDLPRGHRAGPGGTIVTAGGRVLAVSARGADVRRRARRGLRGGRR